MTVAGGALQKKGSLDSGNDRRGGARRGHSAAGPRLLAWQLRIASEHLRLDCTVAVQGLSRFIRPFCL